jgi:hypothetical protein
LDEKDFAMRWTVVKLVLVDLVLVAALVLVAMDQQWRSSYGASHHNDGYPGEYMVSVSYGLLTRVFTMSGTTTTLVSPASLDWLQVIVLFLVLVNGIYIYEVRKKRAEAGKGVTSSS